MKIAFYQMRPFDEQAYIEQFSREFGIDYVTIPGAPCPENLDKAAGCDAVSQNPCEILPEYVEAWARMGVKYLLCRSIGYDHIPLETAKRLGMRVAHSHYPPEGVANYAIMLMLMCTRKMNQTMLRAAAQDYTLPGKMGKDLSNCTVGVIGTGKIGRTVIAHLQGFGCKILAYDLYQSDEVAQMAEYVPLDELYARSDVITLHTNATAENHHLINAGFIQRDFHFVISAQVAHIQVRVGIRRQVAIHMEAIIRVMFECQQVLGSHITAADQQDMAQVLPFPVAGTVIPALDHPLEDQKAGAEPVQQQHDPAGEVLQAENEEQRHKAHHAQRVAERNGGAALPQPPKA